MPVHWCTFSTSRSVTLDGKPIVLIKLRIGKGIHLTWSAVIITTYKKPLTSNCYWLKVAQ